MMSLYKSTDVELLSQNIDNIQDEIKNIQAVLFEPTKKEQENVTEIILDFLRTAKRKIYGGYALNMLIVDKDPKDAIYKPIDSPDIDFYSPEPIQDLIKICNMLYDKGFKSVIGKEAMHTETYSIFVNQNLYCDISYVPRNIYSRMPFKEIKGIQVIHPYFMTVDYLRMLSDPLVSYWRIEKAFKRFVLLQNHYPLPHNENPINIEENTTNLQYALDAISDYIQDKQSIISIGFYAYNYFLNTSNICNDKNKEVSKFKLLNVPYYEIISTNYRDDALELLKVLRERFSADPKIVTHVEHYPFFQFWGHSVRVFVEGELVAIMYHHNKKCIPYFDVPYYKFENGKAEKTNKKVRLGSFSITLLYALIAVMKSRTDNNEDDRNLYHTIISHLIEMRNFYLSKEKKTIFDETLFRDFIIRCVGDTIMPEREKRLIIEQRKKANKKFIFSYDPSTTLKEADTNYVFSNSSGNPINNIKNLKLADNIPSKSIQEEIIEEESEKN